VSFSSLFDFSLEPMRFLLFNYFGSILLVSSRIQRQLHLLHSNIFLPAVAEAPKLDRDLNKHECSIAVGNCSKTNVPSDRCSGSAVEDQLLRQRCMQIQEKQDRYILLAS
jgi:hypothetical protein